MNEQVIMPMETYIHYKEHKKIVLKEYGYVTSYNHKFLQIKRLHLKEDAFDEFVKTMADVRKVENEEILDHKIHKIPRWIRKIFGAV